MQKNNKKKKLCMLSTGLAGILLTGCSLTGPYDVLDKVSDSVTLGESVVEKLNDDINAYAEEVEYRINKMQKAGMIDTEETEYEQTDESTDILGERPEYDPLRYVDVSKCKISEIPGYKSNISDEDVETRIQDTMIEKSVYSESESAKKGDIVTLSYTIRQKGDKEILADVDEEDQIVGQSVFPDEVGNKLLGVKNGDKIKFTYTFDKTYDDEYYAGKTCEFYYVIKAVKGLTLTDESAKFLSNEAVDTAEEYREYVRTGMEQEEESAYEEQAAEELYQKAKILSYPEDVLNYDFQRNLIALYQESGVTNLEDSQFEDYVENLGYTDIAAFTDDFKAQIQKSLGDEMIVLAIAKQYGMWLTDDALAEKVESTAGYTNADDYYDEHSKYYARYIFAKQSILKEIQKNGEKLTSAG